MQGASHDALPRGGRTPLRIVALGGGTGLSTLLRGLKLVSAAASRASSTLDLSAIVTVTDDGGSSGRLRKEFDILAPGDIRNCMAALAEDEKLLSHLFQYRFKSGRGLTGHSFGNLFLTALTDVTGDFHQAIKLSSEVLAIRGRIFPSTLVNVKLEATMLSGRSVVGETRISGSEDGIKRVRLRPRRCQPVPEALAAIFEADLITLGPGSLYTSVIPNLLVEGVSEAIAKSAAAKVYVCNLMWEPGETDGYSAADHLRAIRKHAPGLGIDYVVVNEKPVSSLARRRYAEENAWQVEVDRAGLEDLGAKVLSLDLLAEGETLRHDSDRLAELLSDLARKQRRKRRS